MLALSCDSRGPALHSALGRAACGVVASLPISDNLELLKERNYGTFPNSSAASQTTRDTPQRTPVRSLYRKVR